MARHSSAYRTRIIAAPVKQSRKGHPRFRRVLLWVALLLTLGLGVRAYILHIYAPGLEAEARAIPGLVRAQLAQHNAAYVSLNEIAPSMQHAIVAIEDQRFYQHFGIDPRGIIRAMWVNLTAQHIDQGGSTLEEQLVKRAIVQDNRTVHDKLRTMALAWAVDQEFTKGQILEMYLNDAYYGQGAYGIREAARIYFNNNSAGLTLPQAALLATLPQAPSIYGAAPSSTVVRQRYATVINDMKAQGYISGEQARTATQAPPSFSLPNP